MSNETLLDQIRNERIVCPEGLHGKGWNDAIRYVLATYGGQLHAHAALLEACKALVAAISDEWPPAFQKTFLSNEDIALLEQAEAAIAVATP